MAVKKKAAKKPTKKTVKKKVAPKPKPKPIEHELIPKHELMAEHDVEALLKQYGIQKVHLPKILHGDPALIGLEVNRGDVVRITRKSPTAIISYYYRVVL